MNIDNINRLIAHVEGIEEPLPNWLSQHCFSGMICDHFGGNRWQTTIGVIDGFLDCGIRNAEELSYRYGEIEDVPYSNLKEMGDLPLDRQKAAMIGVLTTLRETGLAEWPE